MIEVSEEVVSYKNLKIKVVEMPGLGSGEWSKDCLSRCEILIKELKINGWWFNHNRGSNDWKGKSVIATFGNPFTNYGSVYLEYLTVKGTDEGFEEFYRSLYEKEVKQVIGRQRVHLFPDQQFTKENNSIL